MRLQPTECRQQSPGTFLSRNSGGGGNKNPVFCCWQVMSCPVPQLQQKVLAPRFRAAASESRRLLDAMEADTRWGGGDGHGPGDSGSDGVLVLPPVPSLPDCRTNLGRQATNTHKCTVNKGVVCQLKRGDRFNGERTRLVKGWGTDHQQPFRCCWTTTPIVPVHLAVADGSWSPKYIYRKASAGGRTLGFCSRR